MINLTNRNNLEQFVEDNIKEYNEKPTNFSAKNLKVEIMKQLKKEEEAPYTATEIGIYLADKFRKYVISTAVSELNKKLDEITGNLMATNSSFGPVAPVMLWQKQSIGAKSRSLSLML